MKKLMSVLLIVLSLTAILPASGCSSNKKVVNVYNWGEYIDTTIFTQFENETGIKVIYKTFESNEMMYSVLKSGGASYDVIIPSDYMIGRMISEEMLEPLDFNNIPNYSKLDPQYLGLAFDADNTYSVPYFWGYVGIVYNKKYVTEPVTSWDVLFDEKYSGQIIMFNNSRDAIGIGLKRLGYSFNTTDEAQITEAVDLLIEQQPLVQSYAMDEIYDKMIGEEAWLGPYYAGDASVMMSENSDLAFAVPDEGANMFVDSMCIPKGAANKENAEAFINYLCSTDITIQNMQVTGYGTPSLEAYNALDEETKNNKMLFPDKDVLARCEVYDNLPEDILSLYDEQWVKLKVK